MNEFLFPQQHAGPPASHLVVGGDARWRACVDGMQQDAGRNDDAAVRHRTAGGNHAATVGTGDHAATRRSERTADHGSECTAGDHAAAGRRHHAAGQRSDAAASG